MKDYADLQAAALCGELNDWCCIPVETFLRYRDDLAGLSDDRIRALHKLACKCVKARGGGDTPPPGTIDACEERLKQASCSSTGVSLLKGLDVILTPLVDIPMIPSPPGVKDFRDAARAIVVVCEKKEPITTQHLTALCMAYEKAKSFIGQVPGGTYAYDKLKSSSLGAALEECCKARFNPPPPQLPPGGGPPPPPPQQQPPPVTPPTQGLVASVMPYAGAAAATAAFGPGAAPLGYMAGGLASSIVDDLF